MSTGYPDYQVPTSIEAQGISDLDVDVTAQTIADLAVDIAAQSLTNMDININKQDLAEVATDIAAQSVGNITTDIAAQSVGDLAVEIASQTISEVGISIDAQTLSNVNMNFNAQSIGVARKPEYMVEAGQWDIRNIPDFSAVSGTDTSSSIQNTTGKKWMVEMVSLRPIDSIADWAGSWAFDVDGDGSYEGTIGCSKRNEVIVFDPAIPIPDQGLVDVEVYHEAGAAVTFSPDLITREV